MPGEARRILGHGLLVLCAALLLGIGLTRFASGDPAWRWLGAGLEADPAFHGRIDLARLPGRPAMVAVGRPDFIARVRAALPDADVAALRVPWPDRANLDAALAALAARDLRPRLVLIEAPAFVRTDFGRPGMAMRFPPLRGGIIDRAAIRLGFELIATALAAAPARERAFAPTSYAALRAAAPDWPGQRPWPVLALTSADDAGRLRLTNPGLAAALPPLPRIEDLTPALAEGRASDVR